MKQAQNQTQTIQVLYELALAIGSSLDLDQMLTTSMQAFADKLDCAVSTVYRCQTSKTACQFDAVGTNSPQADKMETVQLALAHLPTTSDEQAVAQFMATLPLVAQGAADDFYHLLGLPGFGVLLLVKDKAPLDEGLMVGIRPLQEKLAIAANACLSQEQTHNSQGQSQTILESITTPLLISRISDGLILYANDLLADMIGTTAAQLIGNVTPDFYANTADRTTLLTKLQAQGLLTNYELQIKKSSGELIWVLLSIKPFNYQGDPALIATFLDITERKQVLQQLRDSRERARAILESVTLPLIISRLDDGTVLYANERVLEMMGMEAEEIIGNQTPNFYQNPADRTKVIQEAEAHGGVDNMELPIWRKGESRWALISNRLTQYDDQQAIITTLIDITDRKLAEEAQAKRAAELETVARVSASTASILETDKLLQDVVDLTKERFGLYHAHVYLLNKAGDKLMLTAGAGEIGQQMVVEKRSIPLNQEQSLVAQAARTRKGVIENDVLNNPAFLPHPLLPDTRAEMAVPMLIGDKVIGVLDTQADQVGWFTQQDILIKTTLAAQVAVALENARSFESARTSLAETEALLDITKESSRTLELQAILESVLDRVMAATKFEAGLISLENPDTHVLELYNHRLPAKFLQVLQKNGLDNTLCDLVYRRQESIVVDLNGDTPVDVSGLVKLGYNSYQGVPIAAKGDVFGTICLFSTHRLDSDEANTVFLQAVGQQVGIAIQNANLLKQTQVALTEVEQSREVVQEYLDMQRVLHEMNAELLQVDDLDELYRRAIELAHTRLGFERIGMYLLNEAKDTLLGTYGVDVAGNIRSEQGPEHVITDPATINTFVLNRTRLSVAEDIDLLQENEVVGHGWHMGAAMWAEEAAIGVIFADNLLTGQPLKPYQSELLFAYAGAVANLILRRRVEKTIRERETLLRTIIDSTPDWIFVKDQNHRYLLVNQGYADSMQMAPEEFIGKNDLDIGFPEDIVKGNAEKGIRGFWADDLEIMESGQVKVIDIEPAVIEGEQRYLNTIKAPLKDANDAVTAVIGFVHDITDRVQIEETIRERETLLRTIIDSTPDWIFVKDREHRYQVVNQGYADSFDMTPEEFIGKNDLDIGFPEDIVKGNAEKGIRGFWADDLEIMESGQMKVIDIEPAVIEGEQRYLNTIKAPLKDANGTVTAVIGFVHDITDRVQIEETIRERETLLRTIIDSTPDWIFVKDQEHRYRLVNQGYADSMHMAPEEFIGKNDLDIGFPEEIVKGNPEKGIRGFWADDKEIMARGERKIIDEEPAVVDGEARVLHTVKVPLHGANDAVTGLVGFVQDITNRKQIEVTLHQSEEKFRSLFEQSVDAYLILEGNLFVDCNQATVDMLRASSKEEVLTLHPSQFSPERQPDGRLSGEKADEMIQTAVEQGNHRFEWIHRRLDGEDFFAEVLLTPILMGGKQAVFAVIRDVTDRKQAEEALRRNEAELSQALEIAKLSYWEYDVEKDLFTFNDQFYALFHTTAEQHGGYQLSSAYYAEHFVHPDDLSMVGGEIEQALNSADMHYSRSLEHRILYADGGVGYISVNINIDRDEQGNILRYYGANQDITERKRIESAIAKQAQELQIVAELSTTVATTLEQEKLLQEVVDLTKERFEFYHAQIYLLNAQQNRLALAFGAGDVGRTLVAQQHQIALNAPQSLVAQAARSGQAVVVNDVRENLDWLPNKLLPETQAEMAVPMMVGDRVVGVLDVQSASVNRFTDQDVQIQTTLAAQVSIALENARSFEQAQTAVAEMNALTRRLTHEGWDDYFDNVRDEKLSFSFDGSSVQDVQDTAVNATLQDELIELLERPIEVRGVKIGKMALMPEEEDPELEEVVNSVMQQLASHIENLRLTEQVQISLAQTEALYTGSERIVLSSTEADILESLIYSTQLRNLERANIFLFDQPVEDNVARDVTVVAVWENEGVPHTVDVGARFTVDQVPFLSMVTSEAAMVVADIREDPRIDEATRQILQGYGMTSFVLFPMVVGSQWLGMVSGQSARPLYINDVQRRQTSSLVSQASVVLQTTILFRQEQARARREQMLRAIATKVRSSTDVDSIMRTAVTEIGRTLGRRAFIKLSDGQLMETAEENGVAL